MSRIGNRWLVYICVLIMVFLFWCTAFLRQSKRTASLRQQLASLELSIENMHRAYEDMAREREGIRRTFPYSEEQIWFLQRLQEQAGFVRFLAIGAMETTSSKYYRKVSRKVAIEANYADTVRLLHQLEKTHHFVIENLLVQGSENSSRHRTDFTLTSVQLEKNLYGDAKSVDVTLKKKSGDSTASVPISVPAVRGKSKLRVFALSRDPFTVTGKNMVWTKKSGPIDVSTEYRFTGIINFPGKRIAVMESNDKAFVVKEGDLVGDKRVITIGQDEILLVSGERHYLIKMDSSQTMEEKKWAPRVGDVKP